jgi:glycosyltransferase involved in cell wall biosynthesis
LNSSIVEYKKIENAINYFKNSNLPKRNFLLCVAGKLHKSKYCKFIKEICKENKNILLLDYVSEIEKTWLFLNSSLLISTSSMEGFGIPLLDALSINLRAIATDIPSHREIKSLNSKNRIKLINENDEKGWINHLNSINNFDIKNKKLKLIRTDFFRRFIKDYEKITLLKLQTLIDEN